MAGSILLIGWSGVIEAGPIAIATLLSPHLALSSLALVPLALLARSRALGAALVLLALLVVLRFGDEWWSPSPGVEADAVILSVATWNIEAGASDGATTVAHLRRHPVDIVVLQELTPIVASALEGDPVLAARYPYRVFQPSPGVAGIGLLSAFPIATSSHHLDPVRLEARLVGGGRELVILGAHPFPAAISRIAGLPTGFDAAERNVELDLLRARVLELDTEGNDVILIGDFNTAPTEPAFGELSSGLHDAHAEVGTGPGWTWRPARLAFLGTGLLRIDLVLTTSGIRPVGTSIDCPPSGDHCLVEAILALPS